MEDITKLTHEIKSFPAENCTSSDYYLIEISRTYLQIVDIFNSLEYFAQDNGNPIASLLSDLLEEAAKIQPQTAMGCVAKLALALHDVSDTLDERCILGQIQLNAMVTSKTLLKAQDLSST